MRSVRLLTFAAAGLLTVSCVVNRAPQAGKPSNFTVDGKLWTSLWQQRAAEYKALCFQAYNIARLRLDQSLSENTGKPAAIVTDIDETILDNSPNAVHQALRGKDFEQESWYAWTGRSACDTIAGAPSFFQYAASKGAEIFYVTNRDEREREATLKNLRKFGFPNADDRHLLLKQTTSGKEPRRQEILKDHRIVLLIGDNLSDFSALFDKLPEDKRTQVTQQEAHHFGNRFIVLPNANYGDWENAVFNYNYNLSPAEKEKIIKALLKDE